jgi:hypothetical protein
LPHSCADCLKSGSLNLLEPSGPVKACSGIALPYLLLSVIGQQSKTVKCCGRSDITCSTCHKRCRRFCWLLIAGIGLVLTTCTRYCTCGAQWSLSVLCNCFYHGKCIYYKCCILRCLGRVVDVDMDLGRGHGTTTLSHLGLQAAGPLWCAV